MCLRPVDNIPVALPHIHSNRFSLLFLQLSTQQTAQMEVIELTHKMTLLTLRAFAPLTLQRK